jgi:DNA-binding XRE family transcriptional regulator
MIKEIFSNRMRSLRIAAGLSQIELSKSTGISLQVIRKLEVSIRNPSLETAIIIAKFFNVTLEYIFGLSDDPHNTNLNPNEKIA